MNLEKAVKHGEQHESLLISAHQVPSGIAPTVITGTLGGWSVTNPVLVAGVAQPGILAIRGGYGSSGWAQFLRRDGSLPMTGALNMGNQNINAAATVNSAAIANTGNIATSTLATTAAVTVGGALSVAGASTTNGITNTGAISTTTLASTGAATVGGALGVTGTTTTRGITNTVNGITNTGNITSTGNVSVTGNVTATGNMTAAKFLPTTVVASGQTCVGLDGYQAKTAAGSLASCILGVWTTPNATVTPTPCGAQSVSWGSGCGANLSATVSGASTTISPTTPSGATGSATYSCVNGVQVLQSGSSCTLPPCPAQTLSWGSGCSGWFPSVAVGSSTTQSASTGTGSATYSCNNPGGSGGWSYQGGSCTPPSVGCSANYVTWSQYQSAWGGNSGTAAHHDRPFAQLIQWRIPAADWNEQQAFQPSLLFAADAPAERVP